MNVPQFVFSLFSDSNGVNRFGCEALMTSGAKCSTGFGEEKRSVFGVWFGYTGFLTASRGTQIIYFSDVNVTFYRCR